MAVFYLRDFFLRLLNYCLMVSKCTTACSLFKCLILTAVLLSFYSVLLSQPAAPQVDIEIITVDGVDYCRISWRRVEGAEQYKLYSSYNPYTDDWGEPIEVFGDSVFVHVMEIDESGSSYFQVTAYIQDEGARPPEMIFVEGGMMEGSQVASFHISKYMITQQSYRSVMEDSPRDNTPSHFEDNPANPVEMVNWFDAIEYCNRLSIRENLIPVYSYGNFGTNPDDWPQGWNGQWNNHTAITQHGTDERYGYRLATEEEWEFAARGGLSAQNAEPNSFADNWAGTNNENELPDFAWYRENSNGTTHPVGTKRGNELNLFDMSGNASEWIWDRAEMGPLIGATACGGGWNSNSGACSVQTGRHLFFSGGEAISRNDVGFRVVRTNIRR